MQVVIKTVKKDYSPGTNVIVAPPFGWEAELGVSFPVPNANHLPLRIIENQKYIAEIKFDFIVEGVYLKYCHRFSMEYNGEKLITKKIGDWYPAETAVNDKKKSIKPTAV